MEDKQTDSDRKLQRNILDMLRDDQATGSKKNWKAFRDKIRLKRAGKAWTSSVPIPASDISMPGKPNRMMIRRGSSRYSSEDDECESDGEATRQLGIMPERQRNSRLLPLETDPEENEGDHAAEDEQKQAAGEPMSLMSLLSTDGSHYVEDEEEYHEEHHEEPEEAAGVDEDTGDCQICCGCKAKHKGTAFGPCGHTFCKQCTKELHISKGNCSACNDFILEILDLF
ncbi:hypothetical protein QVD17_15612 [Tagetes erecta]|uniref:RING-type domain-containing protein n=1 Tax=Tagetes erecta TaxID=13708 RepID=A0AAD8NZS1_TARER|nr:hypothetical protein QVD17_15612 [Tagetes erecta]